MNRPTKRKDFFGARLNRACGLGTTFLMLLVIMSSCGGSKKSVRNQRANTLQNMAYKNTPYRPTNQKDLITRPLFMQNKKIMIDLPEDANMKMDPVTGQMVLSEEVTFTNADNNLAHLSHDDLNVDTVYSLKEVTVTAQSKFSPEQDGKINVDFMITVPAALVHPLWRVTVTPKLFDNDSLVDLEPLIVKGNIFVQKQKDDYAAYEAYLNSIVDTTNYDSVFLDQEGIAFDIRNRQSFYYDKYYKEWDRQIAFEKWKVDQENANEMYMKDQIGKRNELYHDFARRANEESMRAVAYGMDTVGTWEKYMKQYRDMTKDLPTNWEANTSLKKIPPEFQDLQEQSRTLEDLYNDIMTKEDSVKIAKHRYFFDLIAENELKAARREDRKKEMIQYPFEKGMRDTVIITEPLKVTYPYKQSYPTRIGMKKIQIVADGRIEAVDHSTYSIGASDTISYFVSSMAQLVDMSLINNERTIVRDAFNNVVSMIKFAPSGTEFDINYESNKTELEKLFKTYNDFVEYGYILDSVEMNVRTDLLGKYETNADLADKRANSIVNYLQTECADKISTKFIINDIKNGEDWQGFLNEVRRNSKLPNQDKIIDLVSNTTDPEDTKNKMRWTYKNDWRIIKDEIYPKLSKVEFGLNMTYPGLEEATKVVSEEKPDYDKGVELMLNRDYDAALEIMQNHFDYNTALLLACMGYNGKALEMLQELPQNGYTEYLWAILSIRFGKEAEAVDHLQKACELDPSKAYRAAIDPEIAALVRKFNLRLGSGAPAQMDEDPTDYHASTGEDLEEQSGQPEEQQPESQAPEEEIIYGEGDESGYSEMGGTDTEIIE